MEVWTLATSDQVVKVKLPKAFGFLMNEIKNESQRIQFLLESKDFKQTEITNTRIRLGFAMIKNAAGMADMLVEEKLEMTDD